MYHALIDEFVEGLFHNRHSYVVEELVPETGIDKVTGGMLCTANIEVDFLPIIDSLFGEVGFVVARIHIAEIVSAASCETGHGAEFEGEDGLVVNQALADNFTIGFVPSPDVGMT